MGLQSQSIMMARRSLLDYGIDESRISSTAREWSESKPFSHVIIDNFFESCIAKTLED